MKTGSLLRDEKETDALRKSGIEVVGNIPWGTHLCQFYETKEDLIDILVPYFAEGLRSNEFCMWVTSQPLGVEEARAALQKAVPDLEQYIKKGQIEILPHTDWYLLGGEFDADKVLGGWVEKEKGALNRGFAGLRLTGNTFWIERNRWKSFVDYEATVNDVIGEHRMIAICTYSLEKCTGSDVVDVMKNHESVLFKKGKIWILAEDVYTRRLLEKKVAENQARLQNIFVASPDAITVIDLNGNIVECNQATLDMGGFPSKDEVIGKNVFEFIAEKDRERAMGHLEKTLEQGSLKNVEYTFLTKDGHEYPVELSASVIKGSSGNPTGLVGMTKDITERKRAEEELIRLCSAVKMSTDSIVISDLDGKIIDVNEATLKMYNTNDKKDLIGKNSFDLIAPEEQEKALTGAKDVLEKGYLKGREYHIVTKDGDRIPVEMSVAIMKDADGKPRGFVGISRDITERKKMESFLKKSEERYRDLVEKEKDIIYSLDDKGNMTFASPAVERILGYRPEETIGKNFMVLIPKELQEKTAADFNNLLKTGEITAETVLLDKKGTLILWNIVPQS